jgi:hypothetical protein
MNGTSAALAFADEVKPAVILAAAKAEVVLRKLRRVVIENSNGKSQQIVLGILSFSCP